jgi:hypothetical protein
MAGFQTKAITAIGIHDQSNGSLYECESEVRPLSRCDKWKVLSSVRGRIGAPDADPVRNTDPCRPEHQQRGLLVGDGCHLPR